MSTLDVDAIRARFPALERTLDGRPVVYLDGPAGSQVPKSVADAVRTYLLESNANHGGCFATSVESDDLLHATHRAMADFVGVADPDEIVFGPNMTTLTFALSRALARTWTAGDNIVVTSLDHDANHTPWMLAARDAGVTPRVVGIDTDDCTLDMNALEDAVDERTRLVAVTCASNAVGSTTDTSRIAEIAHAAGALVFFDAVHFAPHRPIDAAAWDADFVACSAYKFFGPHVGVLWGRRGLLEELPAYKVRPASDEIPDRWMTGTQSHEGIAGTLAAVDYIASLGDWNGEDTTRRASLLRAYCAIIEHEESLAHRFLAGLAELPHIRVWGITDPQRIGERVPTLSISHAQHSPAELATRLAREGIFSWDGNFYAQPLTEALGVEPRGLVRLGLLHYNTAEEIDRTVKALAVC